MSAFDAVDFYTDLSLVNDPHPYFAHLRGTCPVVYLPQHDVMAVTTYAEAARRCVNTRRSPHATQCPARFPVSLSSPSAATT